MVIVCCLVATPGSVSLKGLSILEARSLVGEGLVRSNKTSLFFANPLHALVGLMYCILSLPMAFVCFLCAR